jgi:hypothetical protein
VRGRSLASARRGQRRVGWHACTVRVERLGSRARVERLGSRARVGIRTRTDTRTGTGTGTDTDTTGADSDNAAATHTPSAATVLHDRASGDVHH